MTVADPGVPPAARSDRGRVPRGVLPALVLLLVAARLVAVWWHGIRVTDVANFDEGAYFAASALLGRGHVLYRDAVAAHPPGFFLLAAPFTWLGPPAVAINVVRSLNAVVGVAALVVAARTSARVCGDRVALAALAVVGFLPDAVRADRTVLVDPALNLTTALAVAAWFRVLGPTRPDAGPSVSSVAVVEDDGWRRWALWCGVALGAALSVKWWAVLVVPALVATATPGRRRAELGRVAAGAAAVLGAVLGATLLVAGHAAFDQTVRFQFGRRATGMALVDRARAIVGVPPSQHGTRALTVALVVVAALVVHRWCRRDERRLLGFAAIWALGIVGAFAVVGSYDPQYNGHLAPALTLAAGVVVVVAGRALALGGTRRVVAAAVVAVLAVVSLHNLRWVRGDAIAAVRDLRGLEAVLADRPGCVFAFEPGWLVVVDRLPDVAVVGPIASEPFVAAGTAAVLAGQAADGVRGPAASELTWRHVTRCPTVIVGQRGRDHLHTRWAEFERRYRRLAAPAGEPDVWVARDR